MSETRIVSIKFGGKNADALLVRVNLGNCMKLGAEYIIADEKLMIPAYFVSFDVLGPRDPPLPP